MSKFVQFLTVCTGFGPEVFMRLVPVEDVETIRDVTSLFLSGDQDCSAGQTKDDLAIEKALEKYKSVQIVGEDDVEWDALPEGHSIVKVVARYSERQVKSNSIRRRSSVDDIRTLKWGL